MASLAGAKPSASYTSLLKLDGNTDSTVAGASGNAIQVKTGDNDDTPLYLNTDRLGIGTNTPASLLEISSTTADAPDFIITHESTGSSGGDLIFQNKDTNSELADNTVIGEILFKGWNTAASAYQTGARIVGRKDGFNNDADSSDMGCELALYTTADNESSSSQRMCIREDGKVGIGTNAPDTLFHVKGSTTSKMVKFESTGDADGAPELFLYSNADRGDGDIIGIIRFSGNDSGDNETIYSTIFSRIQDETDGEEDGSIHFQTQVANSLETVLSIVKESVSFRSGKHILCVDQDIRFAHTANDTVIVQLSGYKIPAKAIITRVVAVVKTDSDLATHEVNINLSTSSGIAAESAIDSVGSATEILGGGVANTDSSDSTSTSDISMGTSAGDEKEVWICNDQIINGGSDQYIYVCNAGNNGATNSTEGTLSIIIEYYGID